MGCHISLLLFAFWGHPLWVPRGSVNQREGRQGEFLLSGFLPMLGSRRQPMLPVNPSLINKTEAGRKSHFQPVGSASIFHSLLTPPHPTPMPYSRILSQKQVTLRSVVLISRKVCIGGCVVSTAQAGSVLPSPIPDAVLSPIKWWHVPCTLIWD